MANLLTFYLNDKKFVLENPDPEIHLIEFIRDEEAMFGTKLSCGEGGCGACTVCIAKYNPKTQKVEYRGGNSCLIPLCSLDLCQIITIEGLGSNKTGLHPIQQRFVDLHASQCGFCTPGFIMAAYSFLRNNPKPTALECEQAFDGNLCRCTGHAPILDVIKSFAVDLDNAFPPIIISGNQQSKKAGCSGCSGCSGDCQSKSSSGCCGGINGSQCCKNNPDDTTATTSTASKSTPKRWKTIFKDDRPFLKASASSFKPLSGHADLLFPPFLKIQTPKSLHFSTAAVDDATCIHHWFRPTSFEELKKLVSDNPKATINCGNSETGVARRFNDHRPKFQVHPQMIEELTKITSDDTGIFLGAAATWTQITEFFEEIVKTKPKEKTLYFRYCLKQMHYFAGRQIRNFATLAGNVVTGSPISDMNPLWCAMNATAITYDIGGDFVKTPMREFFKGYRKTILKRGKNIMIGIHCPWSSENEHFHSVKLSKRREDDIAICNTGMYARLDNNHFCTDISAWFGGMSYMIKPGDLSSLVGIELLKKQFYLPPDVPGGMPDFRSTAVVSMFFRFYHKVLKERGLLNDPCMDSATAPFQRPISTFSQSWPHNGDNSKIVSQTKAHAASTLHVSGRANYVDDETRSKHQVYAVPLLSTKAHAELLSIDPSDALAQDGVIDFVCAKDLKHKFWGAIFPNEEPICAVDKVEHVGQLLGVLIAETRRLAFVCLQRIKVTYGKEFPAIMTIPQAIAAKSFHFEDKILTQGDISKAFACSDHVISGESFIAGQEHFYFEPQSVTVHPREDDELYVIQSTQNPFETQHTIAHVMGIEMNRVTVRVKRLGGGFGGKESRPVPYAVLTAVAAHRLKLPVHFVLDRDQDFSSSGMRHSFLGKYKVGFTKSGKLKALDISLHSNGGFSKDLSSAVLDRAMFHIDNVYKFDAVRVSGNVCKTNILSATAFRSFGGVQACFIIESIIDHVHRTLVEKDFQKAVPWKQPFFGNMYPLNSKTDLQTDSNGTVLTPPDTPPFLAPTPDNPTISPEYLRQINTYQEGDFIPCGQQLDEFNVPRMWRELYDRSNFKQRCADIEKFNASNKWAKQGICMMSNRFGISFTAKFLNQAGALVLIYNTGSVLVTHSGVEMGQGLHTKMIQIAADTLGCNPERIHISETSTDKVPNTSATAASASSDLNGMAVMKACQILRNRLDSVRGDLEKFSKDTVTFEQVVSAAYFRRVDLSAHGFYKTPDLNFDFQTGVGRPFGYFTTGVGCSQVQVDLVTGDHHVIRSDILMDLGKSLNPAIDVGQISGAFQQGYGLMTMEEPLWMRSNNAQITLGPSNYKIPSPSDVPLDFRIHLLDKSRNSHAIHSSKAVGEPPILLAATIFFAIKNALYAARDSSIALKPSRNYFSLNSPATIAKIRMQVGDSICESFKLSDPADLAKSWSLNT